MAQKVEAIDSRVVSIRPLNGNGVVAYRSDLDRLHRVGRRMKLDLARPMTLATGTRTVASQVGIVELGLVAVTPGKAESLFDR